MTDIVKRLREMAEADYYGRDQAHFVPPEECADEIERLRAAIDRMNLCCDWYWPEDDTSSDACHDSPWDMARDADGDVMAISRGGVIETRYYASLPAADDSDSDFQVDEATEAEAVAKVGTERSRRAALEAKP